MFGGSWSLNSEHVVVGRLAEPTARPTRHLVEEMRARFLSGTARQQDVVDTIAQP